jgi:stage II sporulation protein D
MKTIDRKTVIHAVICLGIVLLTALLTILIAGIGKKQFSSIRAKSANFASVQANPSAATASNLVERVKITSSSLVIPIYLSKEQQIARVPLEQYVAGVVAAEMPPDFELEALKAQAIASRTYIIRRIVDHDYSGVPVKGAWVTDTVANQAYAGDQQLHEEWGTLKYKDNMARIKRAVDETAGLIITYADKPINATFFSTSNGYTENSEDYWGDYVPYLRSVSSPWDAKLSPKYKQIVRMPYKQFLTKLGIETALPVNAASNSMQKAETSQGHRIEKIRIAGKLFSGKDIREKLQLNSSAFSWRMSGETIEITTIGSGHGVGMSQWGANGMAQEGKTAADILKHYYTGIELQSDSKYMKL